jgi:hypothetical protein
MGKKFYASKTLWVNGISLVVAVLLGLGLVDLELSPDIEQFVTPLIFLINIAIRFVTKEPVSL